MDAMSEDSLIRLENLRATKLRPAELSRRVGGTVSYWSDLLAGRKSFGEKTARKIEAGLGLQRGAMDESGAAILAPAAPIGVDLSFDAKNVGYYLDKITDPDLHARTAHAALLLILRAVDGPPDGTTPEPEPESEKAPVARSKRSA